MKKYLPILLLCTIICCTSNKETDKDIISFRDTPSTTKTKHRLAEMKALNDHNFSVFFFSKEHYEINDTLRFKLFLANNSLEEDIEYPLSMSYGYDTSSSRVMLYEHNWKSIDIIVKDTGYCQIPIKNVCYTKSVEGSLYGKITLHLKNGKDSTFITQYQLKQ